MPAESVKVVVRVRPMNSREKSFNCKSCVVVDEQTNAITLIKASDNDQKTFSYDYVFSQDTPQQTIYENTAFPLVENVVDGYNGTICAYGQTGCGKTFTMIGDPANEKMKGIIPRTFEHIISMIQTADQASKKYLVRCSYIEIYNEEIHDLLSKDIKAKMEIKESADKGVFVKDLSINVVKSVAEMDKFMTIGTNNRAVGATAMNEGSSRSHCIFSIYIECQVTDAKGNSRITAGKLNLVDLAGSERSDKTKATGDRLKEATKINLSLSALGNVISALVEGKSQHIPYRDSKLTRLLQDSLGGNTKTIIIAAVSPADDNYDETSSTLRYASRAKLIKNQPKVNEDPKDAQLREYADEIKKLRELLMKQQTPGVPQAIVQVQGGGQPPNALQGQPQGQTHPSGQGQGGQLQVGQGIPNGMTQSQVKDIQLKLQSVNQDLQKQKDKYEQDLRMQEDQVKREREEREKLEALIREKENMFMNAGQADDEEKKKYKLMKNKINKQKQEHERLLEEQKRQQDEFLKMEKSYNNLNEEVEQLRKLTKYLRKQLQEAQSEIRELEYEAQQKQTDLLDNVRIQDKELKLMKAILNIMLTNEQTQIIRTEAIWKDEINDYYVPPFSFKQKQISFPKLQGGAALDLINEEKLSRELVFNNADVVQTESAVESQMRGTMNQFRVRGHNYSSPQVPKRVAEKQPQRNESMMAVNSALKPVIINQEESNKERRYNNVQLQPIGRDQPQILSPRESYDDSQHNGSNKQIGNKKITQLQPMERPPIYQAQSQNTSEMESRRPGRTLKPIA